MPCITHIYHIRVGYSLSVLEPDSAMLTCCQKENSPFTHSVSTCVQFNWQVDACGTQLACRNAVARLQQWGIHRLDQICALLETKASGGSSRSQRLRQIRLRQAAAPAACSHTQHPTHNKAAALWPANATWAQQRYQFGHPTELVSSTMPLH